MPGPIPETYRLPFSQVGFNHNANIDEIPPTSLVHSSKNINLNEGGAGTRGGTSKVNSAAYGSAKIMGMVDFTTSDGTQFLVVATTDGKIWKDATNTITTGLTAGQFVSFVVMNFELYICNGADIPQVWDGTGSTSNLALVPTDWTGTNYPQVMILHGRGNSERLWALGCSLNPNTVYVSDLNDGTEADFSDANGLLFYIETEGPGLTGGADFGDRLIIFDRLRSYVIDDTDTNTDNWGYQKSQFKGGLGNFRLITKTENDLICMQEDGTIYSVAAVQAYGDYKLASLTKPAYIDRWIREYIDLSQIDKFHMKYDPTLRCIKTFMVYKGNTAPKMALPYFIDKGPDFGWAPPHDNKNYASGYDASASCLYRVGVGNYKIYTGDELGNVWELETANKNDDSNGIASVATTTRLTFENSRITKRFMRGFLLTKAKGDHNIIVTITVYKSNGDTIVKTATVNLDTGQVLWGSVLWGSFVWADADAIIDRMFRINAIGNRIKFKFHNNNANEPFYISQNLTDFKYLAARIN